MYVRNMELEDIEALAGLYRLFWNEPSNIFKMREQFLKLKETGMHIFLSAIEDGNLTGSVMGVVCEEIYGECRPFLVVENMVVDRSSRRKGVGNALLSELERQAKEKNCTQMILVTEADRQDACGFYEAYGFQQNNKGYKKKL